MNQPIETLLMEIVWHGDSGERTKALMQEAAQEITTLKKRVEELNRCPELALMETATEAIKGKRCELENGHKEYHMVSITPGNVYKWEPPSTQKLVKKCDELESLLTHCREECVGWQAQANAANYAIKSVGAKNVELQSKLEQVKEAGMVKHGFDKDGCCPAKNINRPKILGPAKCLCGADQHNAAVIKAYEGRVI